MCNGSRNSYQQSSVSLSSTRWFVSNSNGSISIPAKVPGGIYSDLRRANILKQDILYGRNDIVYRWVGNEYWNYQTTFAIDQNIAHSQSVKLVVHGIDTVATFYLNGQQVGSTTSMFVRYKFDIKAHLRLPGISNTLIVKFDSPIKFSAQKSRQSIKNNQGKVIPPYCPASAQRGECHINFIRKMQSSFGWDWGPAFPSVGLYKDITIEFGSFGLIRDILVETKRLNEIIDQNKAQGNNPQSIFITSSIRHQVRTPTINHSVPYLRAPPYYVSLGDKQLSAVEPTPPETYVPDSSETSQIEDDWLLKITVVLEMNQPKITHDVRIEFNLQDTLFYESEHFEITPNPDGIIRLGFNLRIDQERMKVRAWWPNNAGNQTLYKLSARIIPITDKVPADKVRFFSSMSNSDRGSRDILHLTLKDTSKLAQSQYVSEKTIQFGFRTIELIQEPVPKKPATAGLTFNFRINGVDLFAMGSNWIPSSILPEYLNDLEYVKYLLLSAKDANMNMLRVWGGGIYESDEFYQIADELGIMIWHDLMFACALYPIEEDFLNSVRQEVEQQIQRLQYHPSIILWAGNNENEMAISGTWWPEVLLWNKRLKEMYKKLYVETIRPIVQVLDPTRPFLESSPSNGLYSSSQPYSISRLPNDNKFGDVHHYDYISDSFDWVVYPSTRFASEYGFQSYPSYSALAQVTLPSDWKYPLSPNLLHRQHRLTGEAEIKHQLTQAIAVKTETEFYRRNRFLNEDGSGKTMGAMYWQLNDVWAAPTWASIEFGGKWKMLHYFARRFFFPIQVVPYIVQTTQNNLSYNQTGNVSSQFISNPSSPIGSTLIVDLVRDDLFYKLNSFNVTVKLYRWTSFTPVWQESVYILNARPPNVTRIFEQDLFKVMRQISNSISLSSYVFQIVIEQQPRLGLSQIDNYLMPVYPNKITAMRIAMITIELIQGPFQLADIGAPEFSSSSSQWSCGYRLTIVTDSIAMFVWLDLNLVGHHTLGYMAVRSNMDITNPTLAYSLNTTIDILNANVNIDSLQKARYDEGKIAPETQLPPVQMLNLEGDQKNDNKFKPTPGTGSDILRYQFSDNAFNMFEPTKVIDLYLSKCLSKSKIESALEIQSLADSLQK